MASSSTRSFAKNLGVNLPRPSMRPPLPEEFYARSTPVVARELLGKIVLSRSQGVLTSGRIVETEAYGGTSIFGEIHSDLASHSRKGETPRSSVMFGPPGLAYVYLIYGMYEMLNFVTELKGFPGAVLLRALEPLEGVDAMGLRRATARGSQELCRGPGKLCRALGIPLSWNKKSLQSRELRVVDDGCRVGDDEVLESPRAGISLGKEHYWRFFIKKSIFSSPAPENRLARPYVNPFFLKNSAHG